MDVSLFKQTIVSSVVQLNGLPTPAADAGHFQTILSIVFSIVGAICLLMVTIGGLRYVLSHGDPGSVAQAKNTILYSLIGLVVCLAALGIVNFVTGWF